MHFEKCICLRLNLLGSVENAEISSITFSTSHNMRLNLKSWVSLSDFGCNSYYNTYILYKQLAKWCELTNRNGYALRHVLFYFMWRFCVVAVWFGLVLCFMCVCVCVFVCVKCTTVHHRVHCRPLNFMSNVEFILAVVGWILATCQFF